MNRVVPAFLIALALALSGCVLPESEQPTADGSDSQAEPTAGAQEPGAASSADDPDQPSEPANPPAEPAGDPVFTGDVQSDSTTSAPCPGGNLLAPFCAER